MNSVNPQSGRTPRHMLPYSQPEICDLGNFKGIQYFRVSDNLQSSGKLSDGTTVTTDPFEVSLNLELVFGGSSRCCGSFARGWGRRPCPPSPISIAWLYKICDFECKPELVNYRALKTTKKLRKLGWD